MMKRQDKTKDYIWGKRKNIKWIIFGIAGGVVVAGVVGFLIFSSYGDNTSSIITTTTKDSENLVRRVIDGVYVSEDQSNYFPVAVMIENMVSSRPPSYLSQANVVYEALVEGGITRFMALFSGQMVTIPEMGPVRSARPYYLDWALEYGALYVHVGGSPQAFADIRTYEVFDLNQFFNAQYFWRSDDRQAPHNLYTSGEKMAFALRDLEAGAEGSFTPWKFKKDEALVQRPTVEKNITIDFSSVNYKVEYKYDRTENDYVRYQAEQIHRDKSVSEEDEEGTEIRAKNIIVQKVKTSLIDEGRLAMEVVGEGEALVFLDGTVITGTWKKDAKDSRTIFYASDGEEIEFNAGTTWIEVVPTDRDIIYN